MMEYEAIILDCEGAQLVGPTIYEGRPADMLRVAVPPKMGLATGIVDDPFTVDVLPIETVTARCERRRGDGVYIYRISQAFRAS